MAFVNEIIPEEEKEKFAFSVFTEPDGSKPTLWKWTIDKEKNAFLVITNIFSGGYEGTDPEEHFVFSWKGELITFRGKYKIGGRREEGYSMTWQISDLEIPENIKNRKVEALNLINEALKAKGRSFNRTRLSSVIVHL